MKKITLIALAFVASCSLLKAQTVLLMESFDNTVTPAPNWLVQNNGTPVGSNPVWSITSSTTTFLPFAGAGYAFANFNSVTGANTISNFLITPTVAIANGNTLVFYTKAANAGYEDNMQVLLSTAGTSTNVGTTNTSVGDFSVTLLDINPALNGSYPSAWTAYTVTISGLSAPTTGRFAFRHFVTNGGPGGTNSDFIGLDEVTYSSCAQPTITASSTNTIICTTQSVTLNASGATTYTWNPGNLTGASVNVSPAATTVYTVMGTNSTGCQNMSIVSQSVSLCTGVQNATSYETVAVYPNPSKGLFTVELASTSQVIIVDALGKVVYTQTLENGKHSVDISKFANGLYILKATSNDKSTTVRITKD